ncbi:hypothetical protein GGX14DRAFT_388671 [Mycena pura]|uniref:Uncharacterized protein n=1 Tax=Mycena pura TaxID=153505 RepID=A0AAD6VVD2_9AGAR|nr:hypothetical protein GGX14DRAFT_388671 [Mycena pura]
MSSSTSASILRLRLALVPVVCCLALVTGRAITATSPDASLSTETLPASLLGRPYTRHTGVSDPTTFRLLQRTSSFPAPLGRVARFQAAQLRDTTPSVYERSGSGAGGSEKQSQAHGIKPEILLSHQQLNPPVSTTSSLTVAPSMTLAISPTISSSVSTPGPTTTPHKSSSHVSKKSKSKTTKKAKSGSKYEHGGHKAKVVHVSQE